MQVENFYTYFSQDGMYDYLDYCITDEFITKEDLKKDWYFGEKYNNFIEALISIIENNEQYDKIYPIKIEIDDDYFELDRKTIQEIFPEYFI